VGGWTVELWKDGRTRIRFAGWSPCLLGTLASLLGTLAVCWTVTVLVSPRVAGPAGGHQVRRVVGSTIHFQHDVVDGVAVPSAPVAHVAVTFEDLRPGAGLPGVAVAAVGGVAEGGLVFGLAALASAALVG